MASDNNRAVARRQELWPATAALTTPDCVLHAGPRLDFVGAAGVRFTSDLCHHPRNLVDHVRPDRILEC